MDTRPSPIDRLMDTLTDPGPPPAATAAPGLPEYIPFAFPGVPSVGCAFSFAPAGTFSLFQAPDAAAKAAAVAARKRLLGRLGLERWVEVYQVHGDVLLVDPEPTPLDRASETRADGSCTREPGLALLIKTADCQPILLANRQGTAIAALHAGWRGNAMTFPGTGLARFCEAYNLDPAEVLAVRGPSLGPGAAEFVNFHKEWPPEFAPWFDEQRRTMDLWLLTRHQLADAGMRPENIFALDLCTHSLPHLLFSHRRGHKGRQASLIWIK